MEKSDFSHLLKRFFVTHGVLVLLIDILLIFLSVIISVAVTMNGQLADNFLSLALWFAISSVIYITMYYVGRVHMIMWKYASARDFIKSVFILLFSTLLSLSIHTVIAQYMSDSPLSSGFTMDVYFTEIILSILLLVFSRTILRYFDTNKFSDSKSSDHKDDTKKNVMIIGCGYTGNFIVNSVLRDHNSPYKISCIIDDDPDKIGMIVNNVPIVGGRDTIAENVKKYDISIIIFAISNIDLVDKANILKICVETGCSVKTAPSVKEIINEGVSPGETRDIDINDLLSRAPIKIDLQLIGGYVRGKTVLVTGGGGSIGSELCRQLAEYGPEKLIIFDIYENNVYDLQNELKRTHPELNLITLIGSIRDSSRVDMIFEKYRPDIVYHAAAHKHVPLMEDSPNEAIKNNILGTYKLARTADRYKVKRFVMISTDKAVNPTNIMGATKRVCEMIIQTFNNHSDCDFVAVRFGNVLGSNGSVIPLFKKQIENGGPVTVTHPEIIRYFITIPEAVSLVLQAGAYAKGGEIFVLNMGKPVNILDLAKNLITLMGHVPDGDIKIEFTGLRPGEKLYEELLMNEEGLTDTENDRIFIGHPLNIDEEKLFSVIDQLEKCMYDDKTDVRVLVKEIVPTYTYKSENEVIHS